MAQIPDTFELFSETWTIRTGTDIEMALNNGLCLADSNLILLNPNQTDEGLIHTLVHELIHAIEVKLDLEMTERQVDCMALGLLHMFKTNPDMLTLLGPQ
jgi:hypothetical protein